MKCDRTDCFAYKEKLENNCNALKETYKDNSKCPFFKTKKEVDFMTKKLQKQKRR